MFVRAFKFIVLYMQIICLLQKIALLCDTCVPRGQVSMNHAGRGKGLKS